MDTAYRKIDIDAFDDDAVREEDLYDHDPRSPDEVLAEAQSKASNARQYMTRGDIPSALSYLLQAPPYGPPSPTLDNAKSVTLTAVLEVLSSTRSADISGIVKGLDASEQDTLMKFLYKGMGVPEEANSAVLLTWHEKLTEVAGTGTIVRVMTDRKRV